MEKLQQIKTLPVTLHRHGHDLSQPIVALQDVWAHYNGTVALEKITFQLQQGERVAVIGPNGAGKSTLFNVISGVLMPTRGRVDIYGFGPDEFHELLNDLEARSFKVCEYCGKPGSVRTDGWLKTLCDACNKTRYQQRLGRWKEAE